MKKLTLIITSLTIISLTSCSVGTSSNIDINPSDIQYEKDSRTGLCFGFVASSKALEASSTGLGMTCVPCDSVEHLIK